MIYQEMNLNWIRSVSHNMMPVRAELRRMIMLAAACQVFFFCSISFPAFGQTYPVIDTGQSQCFDTLQVIPFPQPGAPFYGQDAQTQGVQPDYQDNGDGTVTDLNTGLMWQQNLMDDKFTYDQAHAAADTVTLAGYNDWRLPTIKELYSLIDFRGVTGTSASTSTPFIDTGMFEFRYGDETSGERFIDAQYISATDYVGTTMSGDFTVFGVNFADGRIKGYGTTMPGGTEKTFEIRLVRSNSSYGINHFIDNGDGTVTDQATGLMWGKDDCGTGLNWPEALAWVQQKNQENYLGHNDWRLPNAKELQSIVDYSRSPQTSNSPAIDPAFSVTSITDEGGNTNYPFYWASTTHGDGPPQVMHTKAVYLAFGEALGFMEIPPNSGNYILMDVHGAGAQRSDPKVGNPDNFPHGFGPQGDVIRIYNFVRPVRPAGTTGIGDDPSGASVVPHDFQLEQNYPNPFNPATTIRFDLPAEGEVVLTILNILGQELDVAIHERLPAGSYSLNWVAENLPSGVYFYRLTHDDGMEFHTAVKKMILLQ